MKRAAAVALVRLAGCGGESWVRVERAGLPAGVEPAGKRAERQGGNDPDAGEQIYKLRPREGERLAYSVTIRNVTSDPISVIGVVADPERDGAFVPEEIIGGTVNVRAGETAVVPIGGHVHGCRFGGQAVPLAGPELELRKPGADLTRQQLDLGYQIEVVVKDGCP